MKLPLPISNSIPFVSGVDSKGCDKVLRHRPNSFLYAPDGTIAAEWFDGSKDQPFVTPNFLQDNVAASLMAQDESGKWMRIVPYETGGAKKQLVYEAGAAYWEDFGKSQLCYDADVVEDNGTCEYYFALFATCGSGAGMLCLKKATKDELFPPIAEDDSECEDPEGKKYKGLVLIDQDGKQVCVKPSCGQVVKACCQQDTDPAWIVAQAGYTYYPLESEQTLVTGSNTNLSEYDIYKKLSCTGEIMAVCSSRGFASGGSGVGGTYRYTFNGVEASAMHLINGGGDGYCAPIIYVPLDSKLITITLATIGVAATHSSVIHKLKGYLIK